MAAKKTAAAAGAAALIRARVLVLCAHGQPDDLVELDEASARSAREQGLIDEHPDAVAYAEQLQQARAG